jgi:two-component system, cell cycle sensor histidine kinase and response regulator CckA
MINIFIVEDEAIVALDLKTNLEKLGYLVLGSVPTGEEALERLLTLSPDLIILDIKLQGSIDGIDTADIINKKYEIPFILLSAYSDEKIIERAKHVEPYGYIIKPFSLNNLRAVIEIAMYRGRMKAELKKMELQLQQAEKMRAVGNLAGGIAHDFNNILTVILGYTTLIEEKMSMGESILPDIEGIRSAALRANVLTKHLLAFSRKQVLNPMLLGISQLLDNMSKIIHSIIPENIVFKVIETSKNLTVFIDPIQIEQVLLNLFINAKDALPNGGSIELRTGIINIDQNKSVTTGTIPGGEYIYISVKDTGTGIDSEDINHIFDPFFTTKKIHKGTGLGLASVYGIIKQSNGFIDVNSKFGQGSDFTIYLQSNQQKGSIQTPSSDIAIEKYTGNESIFVVEDDDEIRTMIINMLNSNGYNTYESSNPGEALLISENRNVEFDLLISDVFMPLMNGKDLSNRLIKMGRTFKTIYISGYEGKMVKQMGVNINTKQFIPKPFQWIELLSLVRSTLDGEVD